MTQAVSSQLPTSAAWVRAQGKSCGICGGQSGTGPDILQVLLFPMSILIPPTAPPSSIQYNTVVLDKEKPCIGSMRGLNLAAGRPTTVQLTNCSFRVST